MLKEVQTEAEGRMQGAVQALEDDLAGIRTGRASPALVERLLVEYYGTPTPLVQLASISVPEARSLLIRPFDASSLKAVERAILTSDLGLTPNNDGKSIRLNLPPLTEERRRELVKVVHSRVEDARVAVRNVRRDAIKDLREFEQEKMISKDELDRGEDELQKLTDRYVEEVGAVGLRKEKEILEI
jgi:ribosome recycling factor